MLNAVRFNQIPSNAGIGLEMKVIAAVVVGGASVTGGTGSVAGTVLGVVLLAAIGPALTFLGVSAYWERAIQGGIILVAIAADGLRHPAFSARRRCRCRRAGVELSRRDVVAAAMVSERRMGAAAGAGRRDRSSSRRSRRTSSRSGTSSR